MELPPYLVPSPYLMMETLVTDWVPLGNALLVTLKITVLSFVLATVAGVLISFLFVQSKRIETALFPYAVLLQVTPIVAVAPLIIIWVKNPVAAMTVCAALVALFPIISNTTLGLRSIDPDLQSYFKLNRATRWQQLVRLRIPSALPYFFGGLRISSGLALIGAVVAEFVAGTGGSGAGLAYQILQAGFQLNIPRMFAALLLISLTGVALFVLMAWLVEAGARLVARERTFPGLNPLTMNAPPLVRHRAAAARTARSRLDHRPEGRVARLSQDFAWFSPVLTRQLKDKRADAVVRPRTEDEIRARGRCLRAPLRADHHPRQRHRQLRPDHAAGRRRGARHDGLQHAAAGCGPAWRGRRPASAWASSRSRRGPRGRRCAACPRPTAARRWAACSAAASAAWARSTMGRWARRAMCSAFAR